MKDNYWLDYWKEGPLNDKSHLQAKVGRTIQGVPISDEDWKNSLEFIFNNLGEMADKDVVDICAGSGVLSVPISKQCRSLLAVDISEKLLENIPKNAKIKTEIQDVRNLNLNRSSFDIAICYFSLQHFSEKDVLSIFQRVYDSLRKDGIFYIGDIPDISRRFQFFNTTQRRNDFFKSIEMDKPTIGTWFDAQTLLQMGDYTGYSKNQLIPQPENLIFSHYRFDLLLKK